MDPCMEANTKCIQSSHELYIGFAPCRKTSGLLRSALSVKPCLADKCDKMKVCFILCWSHMFLNKLLENSLPLSFSITLGVLFAK